MSEVVLKGVPDFDKLEIVKTGTIVIDSDPSITTGNQSFEITHNLGFVPAVLAFSSDEAGTILQPLSFNSFDTSGVLVFQFIATTTKTKLIINQNTVANGLGDSLVKYYLLRTRIDANE